MSGRVFVRTLDDEVKITDPDDARERVAPDIEFCLEAHAHFRARDLDDAMHKLALHFIDVWTSKGDGSLFHAGQVTVGHAQSVHAKPISEALN